jgi:putative transposase
MILEDPKRTAACIYKNRELALADVSDYIHSFYNPTRRHYHLGGLSPEAFEADAKRA